MAAIDDLIAQIEDKALRARLKEEADRLRREKKFGLVFEEHLPELTPVYSAEVRAGCLAAKRGAALNDIWRVLAVENGQAHCLNRASGVVESCVVNDLVAVLEFGDPIFPSLVPMDRVQNGPADTAWHTLIEADNYHALQLLEYLYAGQVDCIYIDPPYNTGARDWKYNNDYVDSNDRWRHSKWLAMMRRRLVLAKRLLSPEDSMLIITIDENELNHLGVLLAQLFPEALVNIVTICMNPSGSSGEGLSRVHEYALFCFLGNAAPMPLADDMLTENLHRRLTTIRWESLMRGGNAWYRKDRPNLCYPILIDQNSQKIVGVGSPLYYHKNATADEQEEKKRPLVVQGHLAAWPVRSDGRLGIWRVDATRLMSLANRGFAHVSSRDEDRGTWTIRYVMSGTVAAVDAGAIHVAGYGAKGEAILQRTIEGQAVAKTMWVRSRHTAGGAGGSHMLVSVLGERGAFSFPKSVYAVRDSLAIALGDRKGTLVLDFFAGSGTTLHAVEMLNEYDGGNRRCILVTNNEVSEDEARDLAGQGHRPGDEPWEQHGVCRSVTWPRSKYTILGRRDDGTELAGEYLTGRTVTKAKPRTFRQLSFIDPTTLNTTARKRELVSLLPAIPAGEIKGDTAWFISAEERCTAAILFDATQGDGFLDALEGMDHVTHFYIVTQNNRRFAELKAQIEDLLGPIEAPEEEKRPMRDGFSANLEYFKLDFLDKNHVALGRQFREILPLLWLRAGAVGARPEWPGDAPIPAMLIPAAVPFAVLVDETRFADFMAAISGRSDLTHLFLVTDSEDAFREMAAQLAAPHVIQLYRDYLENFMINRGVTA